MADIEKKIQGIHTPDGALFLKSEPDYTNGLGVRAIVIMLKMG